MQSWPSRGACGASGSTMRARRQLHVPPLIYPMDGRRQRTLETELRASRQPPVVLQPTCSPSLTPWQASPPPKKMARRHATPSSSKLFRPAARAWNVLCAGFAVGTIEEICLPSPQPQSPVCQTFRGTNFGNKFQSHKRQCGLWAFSLSSFS